MPFHTSTTVPDDESDAAMNLFFGVHPRDAQLLFVGFCIVAGTFTCIAAVLYYVIYTKLVHGLDTARSGIEDEPRGGRRGHKHSKLRSCLKKVLTKVVGRAHTKSIMRLLDEGFPAEVRLIFDLVIITTLLFYIDLWLDIQALITFIGTGDRLFFLVNLSAIVVAAMYTAVHVLQNGERLLADLSSMEIFGLGIAYTFQMHIVYLCWISWKRRKKHQLLIDVKFAEAAIEAVISALVQTYAVVYRCVDDQFDGEKIGSKEQTLYISVMASLLSISSAFTLFDAPNGIDEAPGNEPRIISYKLGLVNLFRLSELSNKISALALFQLATRPYGGAIMVAADAAVIFYLIYRYGGQVQFVPPCVFALMNPMLEKHNAVSMPHRIYYRLRFCELFVMFTIVGLKIGFPEEMGCVYEREKECKWGGDVLTAGQLWDRIVELYEPRYPVVLTMLISTVVMFTLLLCVRSMALEGVLEDTIYTRGEWAKKPFSTAQMKIRDDTLLAHHDDLKVLDVMLLPAKKANEVVKNLNLVNVNAFLEKLGDPPINVPLSPPPRYLMTKILHIMHNTPLNHSNAKPEVRHRLLRFTLETLHNNPALMSEVYVRSRGIHAIAGLILHDCELTEDGLETKMDVAICELFTSAMIKMVRQLKTTMLQELTATCIPMALAASTLESEEAHSDSDKRQIVLTLCALLLGVEQVTFTSEGLEALLKGAAASGSLELLVLCPRLLLGLAGDSAMRTHLADCTGPCMRYTYEILRQLDSNLLKRQDNGDKAVFDPTAVLPAGSVGSGDEPARLHSSPSHQPLLIERDLSRSVHVAKSVGEHVHQGAEACLRLIELLLRDMPVRVVSRNAWSLDRMVKAQETSIIEPVEKRHDLAKSLKLILGSKDQVAYLPEAFASGFSATSKMPGTFKPVLHAAIESGCDTSTEELCRFGAARLAVDELGRTAFHVAIEAGADHLLPILQVHDRSGPRTGRMERWMCCPQDGGTSYQQIPQEDNPTESQEHEDPEIALDSQCVHHLARLENGFCHQGHPLKEHGKAKLSRKDSMIMQKSRVKLGLWRTPTGKELLLRKRHGMLVATAKSGNEVWRIEHHLEVDEPAENIAWWGLGEKDKWKSMQDAGHGGSNAEESVKAESLDVLTVFGVRVHFVQWKTDGLENDVIATGNTLQFNGIGDTSRAYHDWVNVWGTIVMESGLHMYEFVIHKVKCHTFVGVAPVGQENQSFSMNPNRWAYQISPQDGDYGSVTYALGNTVKLEVEKHFIPDTKIGMLLDMDRNVLLFFSDGKPLQLVPPATGLPPAVCLYCGLDSEGDSVTLTEMPVTPDMMQVLEEKLAQAEVRDLAVTEAKVWNCTSCLTEYHFPEKEDTKDQPVQCWTCVPCGVMLCQGCRSGAGPMFDGATALALAAGAANLEDESEDTLGLDWALGIKRCWSKKQVAEALLLACLADNGVGVGKLIEFYGKYPDVERSEATRMGRFAQGSFDPSVWSAKDMAAVALRVSIFASRKDAVEQIMGFFEAHEEEFEGNLFTISAPPKLSKLYKEPWFEHVDHPVLVGCVNSCCATRRIFEPHDHEVFARFDELPRACTWCGFMRAAYHCRDCEYAVCGQCQGLVNRPPSYKEDGSHEILEILLRKLARVHEKEGDVNKDPKDVEEINWTHHSYQASWSVTWSYSPRLDGDIMIYRNKMAKRNGLSRLMESVVKVVQFDGKKENHIDLDEVTKEEVVEVVEDKTVPGAAPAPEARDSTLLGYYGAYDPPEDNGGEDDDEDDAADDIEEVDYSARVVEFILFDSGKKESQTWNVQWRESIEKIASAHGLMQREVVEMCQAVDAKGVYIDASTITRDTAFPVRIKFKWQVLLAEPVPAVVFSSGTTPFHFAAALESPTYLADLLEFARQMAKKQEVEIQKPTDDVRDWGILVQQEIVKKSEAVGKTVEELESTVKVRNAKGDVLRYDPSSASKRRMRVTASAGAGRDADTEDEAEANSEDDSSSAESDDDRFVNTQAPTTPNRRRSKRRTRTRSRFLDGNTLVKTDFPLKLFFGMYPFDSKARDGWTPMHFAAMAGRARNVQLLLDAKADFSPKTAGSSTPLMFALKLRSDEVASRLITAIAREKPEDLDATDSSECTALHFAATAGPQGAANLRQILSSKANPVAKAKNGTTPLHLAVANAQVEAVKVLLQERTQWFDKVASEINAVEQDSRNTPLLAAVKADEKEMAAILLRARADVNQVAGRSRCRPIDVAKSETMVRILFNSRELRIDREEELAQQQRVESTASPYPGYGLRSSVEDAAPKGATVFGPMLHRHRGLKMAEVLVQCVTLDAAIEALAEGSRATKSIEPREVEFFLDQVTTASLREQEEVRVRRMQKVVDSVQQLDVEDARKKALLSTTMTLITRRPDSFARELQVQFLCGLDVDRKDALMSALKRERVGLLKVFFGADLRKEEEDQALKASAEIHRAVRKVRDLDALETVYHWLVVDREKFKSEVKRMKECSPREQQRLFKLAVNKELDILVKACADEAADADILANEEDEPEEEFSEHSGSDDEENQDGRPPPQARRIPSQPDLNDYPT